MSICGVCRAENDGDALFCEECGQSLQPTATSLLVVDAASLDAELERRKSNAESLIQKAYEIVKSIGQFSDINPPEGYIDLLKDIGDDPEFDNVRHGGYEYVEEDLKITSFYVEDNYNHSEGTTFQEHYWISISCKTTEVLSGRCQSATTEWFLPTRRHVSAYSYLPGGRLIWQE